MKKKEYKQKGFGKPEYFDPYSIAKETKKEGQPFHNKKPKLPKKLWADIGDIEDSGETYE